MTTLANGQSEAHPSSARRWLRDVSVLDLRALALFRIALGSVLLLDTWLRTRFIAEFYTDEGLLPRSMVSSLLEPFPGSWSLHSLGGSILFQTVLFTLLGLVSLGLLAGFQTRVMGIAAWALLVSIHNRAPVLQNGGDALLRILLLWSVTLPLDARWALRKTASHPSCVRSWASLGFIAQIFVVYFVAGLSKLNGVWLGGEGIRAALAGFGTPLGHFLLSHATVTSVGSILVPWLEILGALLLAVSWRREKLRAVLCTCFICFHLLIGITMMWLGIFAFVGVLPWIALLPTSIVARLDGDQTEPKDQRIEPMAAAGVLFLLTVLGNAQSVSTLFRAQTNWLPKVVQEPINALGLRQNWKLFSQPTRERTMIAFETVFETDGPSIDAMTGAPFRPGTVTRASFEQAWIQDSRWFYYFLAFSSRREELLPVLTRSLCGKYPTARAIKAYPGRYQLYPSSAEFWDPSPLEIECK